MKHITLRIDDTVDFQLRMLSAHLNSSKAVAAAKALAAGIPGWVMSVSPSEARAMAKTAKAAEDDERYNRNIEAVTKDLFGDAGLSDPEADHA